MQVALFVLGTSYLLRDNYQAKLQTIAFFLLRKHLSLQAKSVR